MSELKPLPCPFCGDAPKLCGSDNHKLLIGWFVVCDGCGASQKIIGEDDSGAAAIEAWNRRAQPAQAGQVLTRDDIVDAWMAVMHIAHATQRQEAFARAIEQVVLAKRVPMTEALHTFLDAAAGEGLVLDGVDAADLYIKMFPERYAAAIAQQKGQP